MYDLKPEDVYNVDYFIEKFESIPDENWTSGVLALENNRDCRCALGHMGIEDEMNYVHTKESRALGKLFLDNWDLFPVDLYGEKPTSSEKYLKTSEPLDGYYFEAVFRVNDTPGRLPRASILHALNLIKNRPETNE